jgi:predicted AlkP superfamily pyrophosphatase or phosphodiesterase
MHRKFLIVQVAALGWHLLSDDPLVGMLQFKPADSIFPALTCPVQATMRTAKLPSDHGMVMNGVYLKNLKRPSFWEQSADLIQGKRIWEDFRKAGKTVGMLFWQQSLGEPVDVLLTPWPVHKHHGGLIDVTYSQPEGLYHLLCDKIKRKFKLKHYWGPLAQSQSSKWIVKATCALMESKSAPDLLFTYLPHLDYCYQKYHKNHKKCQKSLELARLWINQLSELAEKNGYGILVYGDYAIGECRQVHYPNRYLYQSGMMKTRQVQKRHYPDYHRSAAFSVVDHEIAHVYVKNSEHTEHIAELLAAMGDGYRVIYGHERIKYCISNPRSGDIVMVGEPGTWFAYPWWCHFAEAPDYASHIDIHNKPGYDPCELFFGRNPFSVSMDTRLIKGSHGAVADSRKIAWASSYEQLQPIDNLQDLAQALQQKLNEVAS